MTVEDMTARLEKAKTEYKNAKKDHKQKRRTFLDESNDKEKKKSYSRKSKEDRAELQEPLLANFKEAVLTES